ncbi:MAG: class I mannose-6-phosphate isomerase [Planctomycetaceae bacterium]|jgi:mannose-6-phosphate isomerase|nr:class I mannose-6-phosphate isomerase [Planctomycetaceae bacterium]
MIKSSSVLQNTPLYPLRFEPVYKNYLWGGNRFRDLFHRKIPAENNTDVVAESWEISDHPHGMSVIQNGQLAGFTLRDILLSHPRELFGADYVNPNNPPQHFPLLLKYLDAAQSLSVQVHPDNTFAKESVLDDFGKTEAWIVVDAKPDSIVWIGTCQSYNLQEQEQLIRNGHWELLLNPIQVQTGDCFLIPPGTLHALGAGILVAEVQTSSDLTFRLFDWNRLDREGKPRELKIEEGIRVLRNPALPVTAQQPIKTGDRHCEQLIIDANFTLNRWTLEEPNIWYNDSRCHLWTVLEGTMVISFTVGRRTAEKNSQREPDPDAIEILQQGDSILIPAVCGHFHCFPENNRPAIFLDVVPDKF